jgi:hypothetical protein
VGFVKSPQGLFQVSQPKLLARSQTASCDHLADVPRISGAGRFGGNRTAKKYSLILLESRDFLKQIWRSVER